MLCIDNTAISSLPTSISCREFGSTRSMFSWYFASRPHNHCCFDSSQGLLLRHRMMWRRAVQPASPTSPATPSASKLGGVRPSCGRLFSQMTPMLRIFGLSTRRYQSPKERNSVRCIGFTNTISRPASRKAAPQTNNDRLDVPARLTTFLR